MNRYTFLKNLGFRGAALMAVLTSCVHEEDTYVPALTLNAQGQPVTGPNGTTVTSSTSTSVSTPTSTTASSTDVLGVKNPLLKINLATATALKNVGGYLVSSGIVVAKVSATSYAAVTQTCSHEPKRQVIYSGSVFYCTAHGAQFNIDGTGRNSLAGRGITAYKVITDGTTLVVYS
ncbi:Rieske 2Fe-2S domain-containing protein [Fibrivirga algicola]|uniref:Rieske 2Fe-2S domain-containing protein n=1 Tax=Fibrivirga algicola TaxID=2950420 RepID=A0ABX0QMN4_9BACT|nr:Rieske 2Fe-2S domain-containing protein [Fibrivirga algicola]ARK11733.1 (2Fe-2S)-binding protein [Fibrella sp. ES10-3-2-2]NID13392.1 Rieske 2Fe-2S domain-containing protein [Fibrivirga algicola]